ncbi:cadherin-13-like isoform X1 [Lampetra fluviatilis]
MHGQLLLAALLLSGCTWASPKPDEKEEEAQPQAALSSIHRVLLSRRPRTLTANNIYVYENLRGTFPREVGKAEVTDRLPGEVYFRLHGAGADEEPRGVFTINERDGTIFVTHPLDREYIAQYQLRVEGVRVDGSQLEKPVMLEVRVLDLNDNKPQFTHGPYKGTVQEGSPNGTVVMIMTAEDADEQDTDNAELRYTILSQSPAVPSAHMFTIDPETGSITTNVDAALLDRESLPTLAYELVVEARDTPGVEQGLTGTATATVHITDKNDHAPVFTRTSHAVTLREDARGVFLNLTVEDKDEPGGPAWRAVFHIAHGNDAALFNVSTNPKTNQGMLAAVKPLDFERSSAHELVIVAENEEALAAGVKAGPSSTATVRVTLTDVNEAPEFAPSSALAITWRENAAPGTTLLSLNATDPDRAHKQTVRYAVLSDPANWLSVVPTSGQVRTLKRLDRESPFVNNSRYTAVFTATDNGVPPATGTATLVITLLDENDNAPHVMPADLRVCVGPRNASSPPLGTLWARDLDLAPNGEPFIIALPKSPMGLDKTWRLTKVNGTHTEVRLLQTLKKGRHLLPVVATDSGNPPQNNHTNVPVLVCPCPKGKMECGALGLAPLSVLALLAIGLLSTWGP